ncbi:N-acetyltransferase family protein [Roseateles sp. P5_E11]
MTQVRPLQPTDRAAWQPLWDGYNAFYGRAGETALPAEVTETTWARFFDATEPVHALVAEDESGQLLGLVHYLYHRSTTRVELTCYLQDLFTTPEARGRGVGRALIEAVYAAAREAGIKRVYWQTHTTNATGRALYDKVAHHMGFIVYAQDVA